MIKIIDERSSGKTSRLMLLAKENDGILVCKDPIKMRDRAYDYGLVGINFMSYEDFHFNYFFDCPVYIDNVDEFLKFKNKDIVGFTLSED